MADIFGVVADHTRRELLGILLRRRGEADASGDASVSELVAELALSQPTVSKHLKVLREAGLVAVREKGQHRYYRLDPDGLAAIGEWVAPFLPSDVADAVTATGAQAAENSAETPEAANAPMGAVASPAAITRAATLAGRLAADLVFRLHRD